MSDDNRTVYSFAKNTREEIRATLTSFRGHEVADLRVWVENADDEPVATRKGLTLRVEYLPQLRIAVEALLAAASESRDTEQEEPGR